jgi:hypothetical protein
MIAKFNLYDFIANLVPGLTFLWVLERLAKFTGRDSPIPMTGQLAETSVLIILSYVTGLMLQALAERITEKQILVYFWGGFPSARWLLPDDPKFSAAYKKRILDLITERFKVAVEPEFPKDIAPEYKRRICLKKNQELFYLCYSYVDNLSPRPQIFNAQYGLFRCLLTTFALLCGLALLLGLLNFVSPAPTPKPFLIHAAVFACLTWMSYLRCQKRGEDFAKAIYDLFISGAAKAASDHANS